MALASSQPTQISLRPYRQRSCAPRSAGQHSSRRQRPTLAHRRELLGAGALVVCQVNSRNTAAHAVTSVYHEVSVDITASSSNGKPEPVEDPPTRVKATGRIVAIGDLHGDLPKTLRSLELARVLELDDAGRPHWVGGDTVVVQLGDVLDRGDQEIAIIRLLRLLDKQARYDGGGVYMLNGNHESLNVCGDFRYVTPGAFVESAEEFGIPHDVALRNWEGCIQARAALYLPGGRIARELAKNPTVLLVNDTAFAHGGLLPMHVSYGLDRMNREVAAWMRRDAQPGEAGGYATPPFLAMGDGQSVMWNRQLSRESWSNPVDRFHATSAVSQALARVGARRLVVGHTPQLRGINAECDGRVWRVDVGMSAGVLDAPAGVLEIERERFTGATVCRVISEGGLVLESVERDMMADEEEDVLHVPQDI